MIRETLRNLDFFTTFRRVLKNIWCGLAFERVCLAHIPQIKNALGIGGVTTNEYSWFVRKTENDPGAQIDLLLDRRDETINICEIKYTSSGDYTMNEEEE